MAEARILNLRVWVVCATDTKRRVNVCNGCIHRERKRNLQRTKMNSATKSPRKGSLPSEVESVEREQQKIVLFNCSKLLSFQSGDVILPARITCYCRHHQESVGFVIKFAAFDHKGDLVATGKTPPIMITDDHKTRGKGKAAGSTDLHESKYVPTPPELILDPLGRRTSSTRPWPSLCPSDPTT